jgi:branched-subunit amino acid transport protein AzlD
VNEPSLSHLIRASLALLLTAALPFLLFTDTHPGPHLAQAYADALAAVVAFYFGATSTPSN